MSDDAAIRTFPALAALIAIRDAGWTFVHRDAIKGVAHARFNSDEQLVR